MSLDLGEMYGELKTAIDEIDNLLDSVSGSKTVGKRKVVSDLVAKHEASWKSAVDSTVSGLSNMDPETKAAVYYALVNNLRSNFDKEVVGYVDGLVDALPTQEALISEEQVGEYSEKRSQLYSKIKTVVELADTLGGEKLELPRVRRGSSGKRGPRNLSLFTFFINGEEVDLTIGQIAKENGYDKASELTAALKAAGIDTHSGAEIPDFTLPNGKVLSGYRPEDDDDDEDDETAEEVED